MALSHKTHFSPSGRTKLKSQRRQTINKNHERGKVKILDWSVYVAHLNLIRERRRSNKLRLGNSATTGTRAVQTAVTPPTFRTWLNKIRISSPVFRRRIPVRVGIGMTSATNVVLVLQHGGVARGYTRVTHYNISLPFAPPVALAFAEDPIMTMDARTAYEYSKLFNIFELSWHASFPHFRLFPRFTHLYHVLLVRSILCQQIEAQTPNCN